MTTSFLVRVKGKFDLHTLRLATGLLDGGSTSVFKGSGVDFDDLAFYTPGDDVGDIDWKASAHSGIPLIKRYVEFRNRSVTLVFDTGRNMGADAPGGGAKRDIALLAAGFIAAVAQTHGDVVGSFSGDRERLHQYPARNTTAHLETLLRRAHEGMTADGPPSDLGRVLNRAFSLLTRRSLIFIFTDEARPAPAEENILRRLRTRHDVVVVAVADARATEAGEFDEPVADVDAPLLLPAYVRRRLDVAQAVDEVVTDRSTQVEAVLRRLSIPLVRLNNEDEVIPNMVALLRKQKRHDRH